MKMKKCYSFLAQTSEVLFYIRLALKSGEMTLKNLFKKAYCVLHCCQSLHSKESYCVSEASSCMWVVEI